MNLQAAHASNPFITIWEDHETANDAYATGADQHDPGTEGDWLARRDAALQAYYEWQPIREPELREGADQGSISTPLTQAYRSFDFGDVLSLHMLETRFTAREQPIFADASTYPAPLPSNETVAAGVTSVLEALQVDPASAPAVLSAYGITDPATQQSLLLDQEALAAALTLPVTMQIISDELSAPRDKIGPEQLNWLTSQMASSDAALQLLGSPTLMQSMQLPLDVLQAFAPGTPAGSGLPTIDKYAVPLAKIQAGEALTPAEQDVFNTLTLPYNVDAWDGYAVEREAILQTAQGLDKRLITIAGDTHNAWAGHLQTASGDTVGLEFSTPGVTSTGFEVYTPGLADYLGKFYPGTDMVDYIWEGLIPNLEYADTTRRGFLDLTITTTDAVARFELADLSSPAARVVPAWETESVSGSIDSLQLSKVEPVTIGETTALIPEASFADEASEIVDGQSADTEFAFGEFKALATVGEVDADTGMALTGYPDGQAAWLADADTVRVAYQSESYATMGLYGETYGWEMASGVEFTGSHIHTIDYDREGFANFLDNDSSAAEMVKGSGNLFDTVYNIFG